MDYRPERARELLMREVMRIIKEEVKDHRIPEFLSFVDAKVSKDLQYVKFFISVLGGREEGELAAQALNSAAGFMRAKLKPRVKFRYIPVLSFEYDETFERADRINQVLKKIENEKKSSGDAGGAPPEKKEDDGKKN